MRDNESRTEQPTPRRLQRARSEGARPQSSLAGAACAIIAIGVPVAAALNAADGWVALWQAAARSAALPTALDTIWAARIGWLGAFSTVCCAGGAAMIAAVAASAAAGALGFAPATIVPRLTRISLRAGLAHLLSIQGFVQAAIACVALLALCWAGEPSVRALLAVASTPSLRADVAVMTDALRTTWIRAGIALSLTACVEIAYLRRRALAALKMTPREVREERAEAEGKPEIRARRRGVAVRNARDVSVGAIRSASAVVVNPTHVAVALRYAPPRVDVPIVVSRGADFSALLVRSAAAWHDVPIIESSDLARALFERVAVGEPIPEDCYAAVAAIFAWIIRTRGALAGGDGVHA